MRGGMGMTEATVLWSTGQMDESQKDAAGLVALLLGHPRATDGGVRLTAPSGQTGSRNPLGSMPARTRLRVCDLGERRDPQFAVAVGQRCAVRRV